MGLPSNLASKLGIFLRSRAMYRAVFLAKRLEMSLIYYSKVYKIQSMDL